MKALSVDRPDSLTFVRKLAVGRIFMIHGSPRTMDRKEFLNPITGCSVATLTIYDMVKAMSHDIDLSSTKLLHKNVENAMLTFEHRKVESNRLNQLEEIEGIAIASIT